MNTETRQPIRTPALPQVNIRTLLVAIVLVAGFAELAYAIVNISAMPVYIRDSIRLDHKWIGIAATAYLVMEGLWKSPFGVLGDRIGRKVLIIAGPAVSIFTSLLTPHIHNPYALVGLRVLDGLGAAALWPAAFSLIGDQVPAEKRASAMSLFNLSYILGVALGPAIGGGINDFVSVYLNVPVAASKVASFYVAALIFFITTLIAIAFIPNVRAAHHDPADLGPGVEGGFSFQAFKQMLGRMPMTLLMAFVTFTGIGLIMAYTKVFAQEMFGLSESAFGGLLILPALLIAAIAVPLGSIGDRLGHHNAVRIGIGTCALAYGLLMVFPNQVTLVLLGALIGVGFVIAFPAWMAQVSSDCEPTQRGAAVGAVGTAQGLGAIIGALASGFLYEQAAVKLGPVTIPEHGLPFFACGLMLTLSFLLSLLPARHRGQEQSQQA